VRHRRVVIGIGDRGQIRDLDFPEEIPTTDPPITDTLRVGPGWK
jgi:methyl acetate hydrolase